jgi:predicted AlkP superfamily pyrophosphatase or phosphodiesterase
MGDNRGISAWVAAGCALLLAALGASQLTQSGAGAAAARASGPADHVLAISIDGLNTNALTQLGRAQLPNIWRLLDQGMSTLNARTSVEKTVTLPNHTGMLTGRRVKASLGGHGVNINGYTDATVHDLAGHHVVSIFEAATDAGLDTALYTGKDKFDLFKNSWPADFDTFLTEADLATLVTAARADLVSEETELIFLHMQATDLAGHRYGFMSARYLDAVRETDAQIGRLLNAIDNRPSVADGLAVILTADHGGAAGEKSHSSRTTLQNYRIPFVAWGEGTRSGDIYARNPDFRDPGTAHVSYKNRQPVRNANLANLAMDLLGLDAVPGSGIDPDQTLDVN